ncbi:hypothetical protein [Arsenicicoccus piscis]|uniref:Uncharacterized protein n=1 Tax=Arsenicicoccus piscis TaxID=673954 RepID=A0ABQ6HTH3_9MICO|nr:hypothetical protein [Arsenicicoccus piscis]GMA21823.1 hypothetical protein GCM10025862_38440 [Arsenicicoccus piscis]
MATAGSNVAPEPGRARTNPLKSSASWRTQLSGEVLWRIGGLTRVWSASKTDQILGIAAGVLLVVLVLALGAYPGTTVWDSIDWRALWLMPLLLVTVLEPIIIRHRGSTTEISLEAGLLAYLLITVGPMSTLVVWLWCRVAMEFLKRHVLSIALVNGYITTASVSVAALVYQLTPRLPDVGAADYLPVLLAGLSCLVVDLTLTEVCITVLGAPPEIPAWRNPAGVISALATVALTGLGWGAAHLWSSPSDALLPLAIVTVPVLVLAHSYGELVADRRRMRQLVRLLHEMESISTPHEALSRLEIGAEDIIATGYVRVRTAPPPRPAARSASGCRPRHRSASTTSPPSARTPRGSGWWLGSNRSTRATGRRSCAPWRPSPSSAARPSPAARPRSPTSGSPPTTP